MATQTSKACACQIVRIFLPYVSFFLSHRGLKPRAIAIFGTMAAIWLSFSPCGPIHSSQTDHA
jgi:hypothetical protein